MPEPFRIADRRALPALVSITARLPRLTGAKIDVRFEPELTAWRGRLLSGHQKGRPIHAGSHMRMRWIVLDTALLGEPAELERIFVHEIHHFVWIRLGNPGRRAFEDLLQRQVTARGELGWSAEGLKVALGELDRTAQTRRWREYVCESFCDTAAWFYSDRADHPEWTLAQRHRAARKRWFAEYFAGRPLFL